MKILITGAGGFIGEHLCEFFYKNGHSVIGWDIIEQSRKFPVAKVDLTDEDAIFSRLLIDCPQVIIHCAGSADVGKSVINPTHDFIGNVTTTHNLLFAIHKAEISNVRFIFLSSAGVYGEPEQLPIPENAKLKPLSPYALHKAMCEDICQYFYNNYSMDIKILRIFSAYGEGLRKQIFWDMFQKAKKTGALNMFGSGFESRDYINIADLIQAIYIIATRAKKNELIYNIANGEEITIRQATECFAKAMHMNNELISFSGEQKEGNPNNWRADIAKLQSLGYKKSIPFYEGIVKYVNWINSKESEGGINGE